MTTENTETDKQINIPIKETINQKPKKKKRLNHKMFFGALLLCIAWLLYSSCYMLINGGINYDTLCGILTQILPYSLIIGGLGYVIGDLLDKPQQKMIEKEEQDFLNKLMSDASIHLDNIEENSNTPMSEFTNNIQLNSNSEDIL